MVLVALGLAPVVQLTESADELRRVGQPPDHGRPHRQHPFGYTATGLIYLVNRYYDPQAGQFISVDPALAQTLEAYEYAGDNPVTNMGRFYRIWYGGLAWVLGWLGLPRADVAWVKWTIYHYLYDAMYRILWALQGWF